MEHRDRNLVFLTGGVLAEPRDTILPSGTVVRRLRLATTTREKGHEVRSVHRVAAYGSESDVFASAVKGSKVRLSGRLHQGRYTEIVVLEGEVLDQPVVADENRILLCGRSAPLSKSADEIRFKLSTRRASTKGDEVTEHAIVARNHVAHAIERVITSGTIVAVAVEGFLRYASPARQPLSVEVEAIDVHIPGTAPVEEAP